MYCPNCHKKIEVSEILDRSSMHSKKLPFFMCGPCGLMYFNKAMIKEMLRDWKKRILDSTPLQELYNVSIQKLEEHAQYMKYQIVRFKENP